MTDKIPSVTIDIEGIAEEVVKLNVTINKLTTSMYNMIWLQYNMHVDKLDRRPSNFLAEGFVNIMKGGVPNES